MLHDPERLPYREVCTRFPTFLPPIAGLASATLGTWSSSARVLQFRPIIKGNFLFGAQDDPVELQQKCTQSTTKYTTPIRMQAPTKLESGSLSSPDCAVGRIQGTVPSCGRIFSHLPYGMTMGSTHSRGMSRVVRR